MPNSASAAPSAGDCGSEGSGFCPAAMQARPGWTTLSEPAFVDMGLVNSWRLPRRDHDAHREPAIGLQHPRGGGGGSQRLFCRRRRPGLAVTGNIPPIRSAVWNTAVSTGALLGSQRNRSPFPHRTRHAGPPPPRHPNKDKVRVDRGKGPLAESDKLLAHLGIILVLETDHGQGQARGAVIGRRPVHNGLGIFARGTEIARAWSNRRRTARAGPDCRDRCSSDWP